MMFVTTFSYETPEHHGGYMTIGQGTAVRTIELDDEYRFIRVTWFDSSPPLIVPFNRVFRLTLAAS